MIPAGFLCYGVLVILNHIKFIFLLKYVTKNSKIKEENFI